MRIVAWIAILVAVSALTACSTNRGGKYFLDDGPPGVFSSENMETKDAVPKVEKPIAATNKPYTVMGKRYYPVTGDKSMVQVGYGSWYGKKFHGKKTSAGEVYDMYKMTAAHKTMELPSYARVTNLENGRTVIVRVNDRGPFLHDRIIDLSYAAATKLGYANKGTARLKVERITREQIAKGEFRTSSGAEAVLLAAAPLTAQVVDSSNKIKTVVDVAKKVSAVESSEDLADQAIKRLIQERTEKEPILVAEKVSIEVDPVEENTKKPEVKYIQEGVFVMADGSAGAAKTEKLVSEVPAGEYAVQLGVFKSHTNAENLQKKAEVAAEKNNLPNVKIVERNGLYRVLVGGELQNDAAKELCAQLKGLLHQNAVVVKDMSK